nr:unnamed protein product [Spirometra erinaceieuropaei]
MQTKPVDADPNELLRTQLKRCLRTKDLTAYGVASMIGGTIFVLTGTVAQTKTGPAVFLAYIIAGIVALFNALNYSELACRFPKAGSTYTYAYIMLGELPAFLAGWSILLEYILGVAAVSRGWSSNLNGLVNDAISTWTVEKVGLWSQPNGFFASYPDFVALGIILLVSVITCFGIEKSSILNFVCTVVNTSILFAVSAFMFVYALPDLIVATPPANVTLTPSSLAPDDLTPFMPYGMVGLIAGTATCFNAFIGFDMISTCAEEAAEPEKSIPRANTISVLIVTVLLSLASLSLILYVPWYTLDMGAPFLKALVGPFSGGGSGLAKTILFYVVGVGCLIALFSNILTSSIAAPRILYAMGQDGLLFHCLAKISDPFKSPVAATTFIALVAGILTMAFTIESLADFLSLGTLIAYSMTALGVIFIRYCPPPELNSNSNVRTALPDAGPTKSVNSVVPERPRASLKVDLPPAAAEAIDQPGYLKLWWAEHLPACVVRSFTVNRAPGYVVYWSTLTFIFCVVGLLCTVLLVPFTTGGLGPIIWRYVGATLWLLAIVCCMAIIGMHRQFPAQRPNLYRLPMVPFTPFCTIVINCVLIAELSWMTWVRFLIWVVIGGLIYFAYGVRHSNPLSGAEEETLLDDDDSIKKP